MLPVPVEVASVMPACPVRDHANVVPPVPLVAVYVTALPLQAAPAAPAPVALLSTGNTFTVKSATSLVTSGPQAGVSTARYL